MYTVCFVDAHAFWTSVIKDSVCGDKYFSPLEMLMGFMLVIIVQGLIAIMFCMPCNLLDSQNRERRDIATLIPSSLPALVYVVMIVSGQTCP